MNKKTRSFLETESQQSRKRSNMACELVKHYESYLPDKNPKEIQLIGRLLDAFQECSLYFQIKHEAKTEEAEKLGYKNFIDLIANGTDSQIRQVETAIRNKFEK